VSGAIKIESKFLNKLEEYIDENFIPKEVPTFAKFPFSINRNGG
jgi:hypothetical protein